MKPVLSLIPGGLLATGVAAPLTIGEVDTAVAGQVAADREDMAAAVAEEAAVPTATKGKRQTAFYVPSSVKKF